MLKTFKLRHETQYRYGEPVVMGPQMVALIPMFRHAEQVVSQTLTFTPSPSEEGWHTSEPPTRDADITDVVRAAKVSFNTPISQWSIINTLILATKSHDLDPALVLDWDRLASYAHDFPFSYGDDLKADLAPFLGLPESTADLIAILRKLPFDRMPTMAAIDTISQAVAETPSLSLHPVSALVHTFRAVKLAARYVTGYDLAREGQLDMWAQVYLPGMQWVDVSPDKGVFAPDERIALVVSSSYEGTRPVSGIFSRQNADEDGATPEVPVQVESWVSLEAIELDIDATVVKQQSVAQDITSDNLNVVDGATPETHKPPQDDSSPDFDEAGLLLDERAEALARQGEAVTKGLSDQGLRVASFIEVRPNERPSKVRRTSWQDIVYDLRDRLKSSPVYSPTEGRLHNLHEIQLSSEVTGTSSHSPADLVQRAQFFALAFPSLSRYIGQTRFDGPAISALQEATEQDIGGAADQIWKTRHDQHPPFLSLAKTLLDRMVLLRMAQNPIRFAPVSQSQLNDAFRLPTYLQRDFQSCCQTLSSEDLTLDPAWFAANAEANFPVIESDIYGDVTWEIRQAYRDQVEKHRCSWFEICISGDLKDRYQASVNGWRLPLRRLNDKTLAGVRLPYLNGPLHLSLFDTWKQDDGKTWQLEIKNGAELEQLSFDVDVPKPPTPQQAPSHPDLAFNLDVAWAESRSSSGR